MVGADQLFIPNKSMSDVSQPGYRTDMQTIETFINHFETGTIVEIISSDGSVSITDPTGPTVDLSVSGGGGGYDSLTGPGETSPTGKLTQSGELEVLLLLTADDGIITGTGATNTLKGTTVIENGPITISNTSGGNFIDITTAGSTGQITISAGSGGLDLSSQQDVSITAGGAGHTAAIGGADTTSVSSTANGEVHIQPSSTGKLSFYGQFPAVVQAAAPTTLGQVITLLTNLGLCA